MGIWEWVGSTAGSIKQYAPSIPTPIKNGVGVSYDYGCAAFTKIDQTVRVNGLNRLGQRLPDDETRAKMSLYATKFAKNAGLYALQEGYKLLPGGNAFSKILSNTLNDVKLENLRDEKIKRLEEKSYTPKKHSSGDRKTIEGAEIHGGGAIASASNDGVYTKSIPDMSPEDVIRVFMMKEFIGNRFLDDLMVPTKTTRGKKAEYKADNGWFPLLEDNTTGFFALELLLLMYICVVSFGNLCDIRTCLEICWIALSSLKFSACKLHQR